jgi:hypothetical protein
MTLPVSTDPPAPAAPPLEATPRRNRRFFIFQVFLQILILVGAILIVTLVPTILAYYNIILTNTIVDYLIVMMLGVLVGFIEIISRYQDAPFKTALTWPSMFYMWVNALVAASALWLIRLFGWNFLPVESTNESVIRWTQVITAGLGAMAIFRSSLFVMGKEDKEIAVGPSTVLKILLDTIDKEVDRVRGQERAQAIKDLMENIDYEDVTKDLINLCTGLMQNLSDEENQAIEDAKAKVVIATRDPEVRKYLLGLKIIDLVGEDILRQAIQIRGKEHYRREYLRRLQNADSSQLAAAGVVAVMPASPLASGAAASPALPASEALDWKDEFIAGARGAATSAGKEQPSSSKDI